MIPKQTILLNCICGNSLSLSSSERGHESLYMKDVRWNSWEGRHVLPCVPDSGIWQPSWCLKLLSLHSPQSVPRYTRFCQSSLPENDKKTSTMKHLHIIKISTRCSSKPNRGGSSSYRRYALEQYTCPIYSTWSHCTAMSPIQFPLSLVMWTNSASLCLVEFKLHAK